jgi:hypothetical protein
MSADEGVRRKRVSDKGRFEFSQVWWFPPFAKDAKDGAPSFMVAQEKSGRHSTKTYR